MIYPYMAGKKNWGTYARTYAHSLKFFAAGDPVKMAFNSGTLYDPQGSFFLIKSFGQDLTLSYPGGSIYFRDSDISPPFSLCLPALNSLVRADGAPVTGRLISYKELEDGHVFYPAFQKLALNRLSTWLEDKDPALISAALEGLGGFIIPGADIACTLYPLPRFPVTIKIWFPDEEMPGSAGILFDASANHYLHTEDIAAIGELAAHFLIRHYDFLSAGQRS